MGTDRGAGVMSSLARKAWLPLALPSGIVTSAVIVYDRWRMLASDPFGIPACSPEYAGAFRPAATLGRGRELRQCRIVERQHRKLLDRGCVAPGAVAFASRLEFSFSDVSEQRR